MRNKKTITWIAVMDGKEARFYSKDSGSRLGELKHTMNASPIRTDKPSGRRELGRVHDCVGVGRHIIEPHTSDRTQERKQFMKEVAAYLDGALQRKEYGRLIIAASPKILGFLRKELSKPVKDMIAFELDKDFMSLSVEQIQEKFEELVYI